MESGVLLLKAAGFDVVGGEGGGEEEEWRGERGGADRVFSQEVFQAVLKKQRRYEGGGGDGGGRLEVIRQGERLCDKGAWRRQGRRRRQGTGKSDFRQGGEVEGEKGGVVAVRVDGQWSEMCAVGEGTLNSPGERWRLLGRNNRALTK